MSLDGITGSGNAAALRGADAVARAGGALSSQTTRQRYSPLDAFQISGRPRSQRPPDSPEQQPDNGAGTASSGQTESQTQNRSATAFLVQSLAQGQDQAASSAPPVSQITAGLRAYARSVGATVTPGNANVEIIPPQLSSGHALDLAV